MLREKGLNILIVGGDSTIGSALGAYLKSLDIPYYYSTRRLTPPEADNALRIDLAAPVGSWELPNINWDWIIYCAGITSIAACKENPEETRNINVTKTIALVKKISTPTTKHLYLSTSLVFSGENEAPSSDKIPNPQTEYGKQKLEVEQFLLANFPGKTTILRLSKVLHPKFPLCVKWIRDLKENKPIHPFDDLYLAPVFLPKLVELLVHLINKPVFGILHFSGKALISYYHLAQTIVHSMELDGNLIIPAKKNTELFRVTFCARLENSSLCIPFAEDFMKLNY